MAEDAFGQKLPPPIVSHSCRRNGICDEVKNYPTLLARQLIKELKQKHVLFNVNDEIKMMRELEEEIQLSKGTPKFTLHKSTVHKISTFAAKHPKMEPRFFNNEEDNEDYSDEESEGIKLCDSTLQLSFPKLAQNRNKKWNYILNDDNDPVQVHRVEICKFKHSKCSEELHLLPTYESECIQKKTYKEMYYIDSNGKAATDFFEIPTCCSCRLFHTNE